MIVQAFGPEAAPIVGHDLVQSANHVLKCVCLHHRAGAGFAMKKLAKIVQALCSSALLPDNDIGPEPVQRSFIVEIRASTPRPPGGKREIKLGCGGRPILQDPPVASPSMVQFP